MSFVEKAAGQRRLILAVAAVLALVGLAAWQGMIRPADTSSPRATLKSFIDAANEAYRLVTQERYFQRDLAGP